MRPETTDRRRSRPCPSTANAIADTLVDFPDDENVFSSRPPGRSHWLEKDLFGRARERYDVPVDHVISEYGL